MKRSLIAAVSLLSLILLTACSSKKEKPYKELQALTPKVDVRKRWTQSVGSGLSKVYRVMAPVIDKETVYANDYKGRVFAFQRETGDLVWEKALKMDPHNSRSLQLLARWTE